MKNNSNIAFGMEKKKQKEDSNTKSLTSNINLKIPIQQIFIYFNDNRNCNFAS